MAGARPNFMKVAPIFRESRKHPHVVCELVHTGQHYDYEMSGTFLEDLELPRPDFLLGAGSGSHAVQTAKIMTAFEEVCLAEQPYLVIVVGDVNSTMACSIVAKKLSVRVAHVEAGLRSFDLSMPEEVNRIVTDSISDFFFVTEESAVQNLLTEGRPENRIFLVGHVMIDNLLYQARQLENGKVDVRELSVYSLKQSASPYVFVTLHRPSNVDNRDVFEGIADGLNEIARTRRIFFPVHPRTKQRIEDFNIAFVGNVTLLPPLNFKESLFLWKDAEAVLTDSGGLQEETTALGVPCVTIRENTERPVTVEMGTNVLGGTTRESILQAYLESMEKVSRASVPPYWDGRASERIWDVLTRFEG